MNPLQKILDELHHICGNCGLTFGSHKQLTGDCPGHEAAMDWDKGPGTRFKRTGRYGEVEGGTPARMSI